MSVEEAEGADHRCMPRQSLTRPLDGDWSPRPIEDHTSLTPSLSLPHTQGHDCRGAAEARAGQLGDAQTARASPAHAHALPLLESMETISIRLNVGRTVAATQDRVSREFRAFPRHPPAPSFFLHPTQGHDCRGAAEAGAGQLRDAHTAGPALARADVPDPVLQQDRQGLGLLQDGASVCVVLKCPLLFSLYALRGDMLAPSPSPFDLKFRPNWYTSVHCVVMRPLLLSLSRVFAQDGPCMHCVPRPSAPSFCSISVRCLLFASRNNRD